MKCSGSHLFTPLYLKLHDAMPWPEQENAFYLLSSDGLFLCRNTPFFRSCVPVEKSPSELAKQEPFLKLSYPRIPRRLMEQVVGFFDIVGERYASEAGVLIAWNSSTGAVEIVVPDQVGYVGTSYYGKPYPLDLEYEVPSLPPHLVLIGDIHSHVDGPAYASYTDKSDETHRPGIHLVIGRILDEPPQFHCEATADGFRFKVRDLSMILEGYHRRRVHEVPPEWISKVTVKPWTSKYRYDSNNRSSCLDSGGSSTYPATGSYLGTGSYQGTGSYLSPKRSEEHEAKPLRPEDKTDGARALLPGKAPPTDSPPHSGDGHPAKPPATNNPRSGPQSSTSSDLPPTP